MKKNFLLLVALLAWWSTPKALCDNDSTRITLSEAKNMYKTQNMGRVSVHDPSIVYQPDENRYYIFGSHRGQAKTLAFQSWTTFLAPWGVVQDDGSTKEASNQEAFVDNQVKTITIGGKTVDFGTYDVQAWAAAGSTDGNYDVGGMMWAPDVIYNKEMKKWCMYLSINGDYWASSIILLTSDDIDGTYVYQGPVVFSGFRNTTNENISWKKTDLELVIGEQSTLPSRYNQGNRWGSYWVNAIDPCVFYDEDGKLWMTYGSWSGGIWILQLNPSNGLRDYDVTYDTDYDSKGENATTDAYYGKKIAGGHYVSGEGSYVEYIDNHYYLFVTNGGLTSDGGYEMRVFRSKNPDGPYTDPAGVSAIYEKYKMNYGTNGDTRGLKILGAYDKWGFMTDGELAQGHNSLLHTKDNQNLLIYHTRFLNQGEGHQVRCHQVYLNKNGWPVAAPFEYHSEATTDDDIKSKKPFTNEQLQGTYQLLFHQYNLDYANKQVMTPISVTLNSDGSITGDATGTWQTQDASAYITLVLSGTTYEGVVTEQQMEPTTIKSICLSAVSAKGLCLWAYKMRHDHALAYQLNNMTFPVRQGQSVNKHIDLLGVPLEDNVNMTWTSSRPDLLSETGRYNPQGLTQDENITLTLRLSSGTYYFEQVYNLKVKADTVTTGDFQTGMQAYYSFDDNLMTNAFDNSQRAVRLREGSALQPARETDTERASVFIHQYEGANGSRSYTRFSNPLYQQDLQGATISCWVKRLNADDAQGALFAFVNSATKASLFVTGNTWIGLYDTANSTQLNVNHPDVVKPTSLTADQWDLLTITLSPTDGLTIYVNKQRRSIKRYSGTLSGTTVSKEADVSFSDFLQHIANSRYFYFGYGNDHGSAAACFDDLIIYNRALTAEDVARLYAKETQTYDFSQLADAILLPTADTTQPSPVSNKIYNLNGQAVSQPQKGIYIVGGKKIIFN